MTAHRTKKALPKQEYVLLPLRGTRSEDMAALKTVGPQFNRVLRARLKASSAKGEPAQRAEPIDIVHSTADDGAKLASMSGEQLAALRVQAPAIRAIPVVLYHKARSPKLMASSAASHSNKKHKPITILVKDQHGKPMADALVVALTDMATGSGADAQTNSKGAAQLKLGTDSKVQVLAIYPGVPNHWGLVERDIELQDGMERSLPPLDLAVDDFVTDLYKQAKPTAGVGVTVGIIDSGVDGTHPDLNVLKSRAFVISENDQGDGRPATSGGEHGTHDAGLVASRGSGNKGRGGRAPGVTLNSYRVFPNSGGDAKNYDILRAIEAAVDDGCDLINLSLGTSQPDDAVRDAIKEAFDRGTVCLAAAGNDERQPLLYPAGWSEVISVTAIGHKGLYPVDSTEVLDEATPASTIDKKRYAARFTNIGPEVVATAPGVGIVSTLPKGGYGPMSGTSMSCPVACGLLAAELSKHPQILAMPRDEKRALEIKRLFFRMCKPAGFDKEIEGLGLPL